MVEYKLPFKCVAEMTRQQPIIFAPSFPFSQWEKIKMIGLQLVRGTIRGRVRRLQGGVRAIEFTKSEDIN